MNQSETTSAAGGGETHPSGTAQRLIQRLEDAASGGLFICDADREEAVEIAIEEMAGSKLKPCPEEGSDEHLCSFPSCTCAYQRLPCPPPSAASTAKGGTEPTRRERALDEALREAVAMLEVDKEADEPGSDLYTWLRTTAPMALGLCEFPPPPAEAAGGGSGDIKPGLRFRPKDSDQDWIVAGITDDSVTYRIDGVLTRAPLTMPLGKFVETLRAAGGCSGDLREATAMAAMYLRTGFINCERCGHEQPTKDTDALYTLDEALSAPTPDLGAQGEPVAWAYEYNNGFSWLPAFGWKEPAQHPDADIARYRNIRPLYEAPAAPRPGSGVSMEEIAEALWDDYRANQGSITISVTRWQALAEDSPAKTKHRRQASAMLALFAQAPRDGGETQGGWRLVPEEPTEDLIGRLVHIIRASAWGRENVIKQYRWLLAAAPTPPSGVETIRQDSEGATDA